MGAEYYHCTGAGFSATENLLLDYNVDDDQDEEPDRAGFTVQLRLSGKFSNFPCLTVYKNTGGHPYMPIYMVDVRGDTRRLAWYAADDFQSLQMILKHLAPLTRYKRNKH